MNSSSFMGANQEDIPTSKPILTALFHPAKGRREPRNSKLLQDRTLTSSAPLKSRGNFMRTLALHREPGEDEWPSAWPDQRNTRRLPPARSSAVPPTCFPV